MMLGRVPRGDGRDGNTEKAVGGEDEGGSATGCGNEYVEGTIGDTDTGAGRIKSKSEAKEEGRGRGGRVDGMWLMSFDGLRCHLKSW